MLQPNLLSSGLLKAMRPSRSASHTASEMADAYRAYAAGGTFGLGLPVITAGSTQALEKALFAAMVTPALGSPVKFSAAWQAGILAFWSTPIAVIGPQAGSVVGCPGAASLAVSMLPAFSNPLTALPAVVSQMVSSLVTATLTVTASIVTPVPTVVSIL